MLLLLLLLLLLLQASFDPPGITVSVKKDRTLETMLQPGNAFAVSMITESQAKRVRKVRQQLQYTQHRSPSVDHSTLC